MGAPSSVVQELSHNWPSVLAAKMGHGRYPDFLDVYFIVGVNPDTGRYVGYVYSPSTSEAFKASWVPRCRGNMEKLFEVRVPIRTKTREGCDEAYKEAVHLMHKDIWKSQEPNAIAMRNKMAEDFAYWKERGGPGIPVERVDQATFAELLKGRRL